ncbi:MAG: lysophospholipid acyltransferase family protein [Gammaproteobacteria bacterium]|nr:lysophospholipid acyltransferase family protein [Gammaproteobacteria bacterium]
MLKSRLARGFLRVSGWAFEGEVPEHRRFVLIAAPHTSNWDFVFMIAMALALGVRLNWMGKAPLFEPPLGRLFRALGGIPTRQDRRSNLVEQSAARFAERDELILAVPAEGTRRLGTTWRSGFYHIARLANVPIVLGYLDYARKRGGLGPAIVPSADVSADMDRIRAFYADKVGRYPDQFTPPRLAEEHGKQVDASR